MLALIHMMMVCPKCGFSQPADQFCAQCGVDVSHFQAKPKPWVVRFIQDPNTHLFLVGCLVVVILGYIFYTQRGLLGKEMGTFLNDIPLLSKEAGDKSSSSTVNARPPAPIVAQPASKMEKVEPQAAAQELLPDGAKTEASTEGEAAATGDLNISFWEVSRSTLNAVVATADKTDNGDGKVFIWTDGTKLALEGEGNNELEVNGNALATLSTPLVIQDGAEDAPLHFTARVTVSKGTGQSTGVLAKVAMNWQMTMAEAGKSETSSMSATATIPPKGVAMVVIDLEDKAVSAESLQVATGPMSILASDRFRSGATDWVLVIRPK